MARLTIITGPMFSGKSEELIRIAKRTKYAHKKILSIKPSSDTRQDSIRSRALEDSGEIITVSELTAIAINNADSFERAIKSNDHDILLIDEAHFFPMWLSETIFKLTQKDGPEIFIAGLDQTAWGLNFGPMGELMAIADKVVKLTAVCFHCGADANMTFKAWAGNNVVEVGDSGLYEARCRRCWHLPQ